MLREALTIMLWNLRSFTTRLRPLSTVVLGFFGVILVFTAVVSIRDGLIRALRADGLDGVAIVTGKSGASLDPAALAVIGQAPGVAVDAAGPRVTGTLATVAQLPKWGDRLDADAEVRGVDAHYPATLPGFRLVQGRMLRAGLNEMVIGEGAEHLFPNLRLGATVRWAQRDWTVVGVFATGSSLRDSSILADVGQIQSLTGRPNEYSAAYARLTSPGAYEAFEQAVSHDARLNVDVKRLSVHDQEAGGLLDALLLAAISVITLLMAIGAVFGALNVMYASIAQRAGEIATLRAIGFRRPAILAAILLESLTLALAGGILGLLVAYVAFDGYQASTSTGGGMFAFRFAVTPQAARMALWLAAIMGLLGGLFPALRGARLPVAQALRQA